jgi:hypothetical protein
VGVGMTFATIIGSGSKFFEGFDSNFTAERISATGGVLPSKLTHLKLLQEKNHIKIEDLVLYAIDLV